MADIGDILGGIGRGAAKGLGVALTPVAMAMAARSGRNPLSAMPGYTEPLGALEQARLGQLQSQADFNRAIVGQLQAQGLLPGGQQAQPSGIGGEAPYYLGAPGAPTTAATTPQPGILGSALGSIAESAASGPRQQPQQIQAPQGQVVQRSQQPPLQIKGVGVTGSGNASVNLGPAEPFKVRSGTPNPTTGKPFAAGDVINGRPVIVEPSTQQSKIAFETAQQRIRSTGARGFLDSLEKSINKLPFAESGGDIAFAGPMLYYKAYWEGDADAVNIQTALGRLPVLVEALQRDGRISNQDALFLKENLPSFWDIRPRALAKLAAIRETLDGRNINLDIEMKRLNNEASGSAEPSTVAPATPAAPRRLGTETGSLRDQFRSRLGGGVVARAAGGPVAPMQTALVGEKGPELLTMPQASYVTPMAEVQQAQANRIARAGNAGAPMQLAQVSTPDAKRGAMYTGGTPTTTIPPSGIRQGVGMAEKDVEKARSGGTVVWDPVLQRAVTVQ